LIRLASRLFRQLVVADDPELVGAVAGKLVQASSLDDPLIAQMAEEATTLWTTRDAPSDADAGRGPCADGERRRQGKGEREGEREGDDAKGEQREEEIGRGAGPTAEAEILEDD
jgi:hypothetical protein